MNQLRPAGLSALVLASGALLLSGDRAAAQTCTLEIAPAFPAGDFFVGPSVMREFDADGLPQLVVAGGTLRLQPDGSADRIMRWDGAEWLSLGSGLNGTVSDMVVWDADAGGPIAPALFVGGFFTSAGGVPALGIAKWDGNTWQALPPGPPYMLINAMTIHDADGAGAQLPQLIVAGYFPAFVGSGSRNIARWNGTTWSALSVSAPSASDVTAVTSYDQDAGGGVLPTVVVVGNDSFGRVIRLVNSNWTTISVINILPTQLELATFDPEGPALPELILAGQFTYPGVPGGAGVVRWNGTTWNAIGGGVTTNGTAPGFVTHLDVFDPDGAGPLPNSLFVSGEFSDAGGMPVNNTARWDGTGWNAVASPNGRAFACASFDEDGAGIAPPESVVSGRFTEIGGTPASRLAISSPEGWVPLGTEEVGNGLSGMPRAYELFDPDADGPAGVALFVGGFFWTAGTIAAPGLAVWNGDQWSAPPFPISGSVYSLKSADIESSGAPHLFIAGYVEQPGLASARGLVRWDGQTLDQPGPGLNGTVIQLELYDPDGAGPRGTELIAGGSFSEVAGIPNSRFLAGWNGYVWAPLGGGISMPLQALTTFDPDGEGPGMPLLVAGGFNWISYWNGVIWTSIGGSMSGLVYALNSFDSDGGGPASPRLYAGGSIGRIAGQDVSRIAAWDGSTWSPLGSGVDGGVNALLVHDFDGDGPATPNLIVAGGFSHAGGQPVSNIALWDGATWSAAPLSTNGSILSLGSMVDGFSNEPSALYIGGSFNQINGIPSESIARVTCTTCTGDTDGDFDIDLADLATLLAHFGQTEGMEPEDGDLDADGDVDLADLTTLLSRFAQPC